MKNINKIPLVLFILNLSLFLSGYFILFSSSIFPLCSVVNCSSNFWIFSVAKPLYWSLGSLLPVFFGLMFVKEEVFKTWLKVALPVGILFILIALWAPPLPVQFTPDRTAVTNALSYAFAAISAFVVGWKYWSLSRK